MNGVLRFTSVAKLVQNGHYDEGKLSTITQTILDKLDIENNEKIKKSLVHPSDFKGLSWRENKKQFEEFIYVSSWTVGNEESTQLWKDYAPEDGVIIKSNSATLENINSNYLIYFSEVTYHDDNLTDPPLDPPKRYIRKGIESKKDNEFRALTIVAKRLEFIEIPIDLNVLLSGDIIVHPNTDLNMIQSLLNKYNVNKRAVKSKLQNPFR